MTSIGFLLSMKSFWNKVCVTKPCWLWVGALNKDGYGNFGSKLAHRVSWEIHYGKIPIGLCVLHRCDVPNCVNPQHLFLGTHSDNMQDMFKKGRCNRKGEHNSRAILNKKIVQKIRLFFNNKKYNQRQLAEKYGVCKSTISAIICNINWKE